MKPGIAGSSAPAGGAEPDIPSVTLIGVILALIVVLSIFGVEAAYYALAERENTEKVVSTTNPDLARYRDEEDSKLNAWRWVDRSKDLVAMPIERAMELEAAAHAAQVPAAQEPATAPRSAGSRQGRGTR